MLDIGQLLSLSIVTFSLPLTGASLIAYKRTGLRKFFIVSLAFLLYVVKELVEHVDIVFPEVENSGLELMTNLVEFLVIAYSLLPWSLRREERKMNDRIKLQLLAGLTVVLIILLFMELVGLFNGINTKINSTLPSGGSFIALLTGTASLAAVVIYLILFLLWDLRKLGKISRFTLGLAGALFVSMLIVAVLKVLLGVPRPGEAEVSWGFLQATRNLDYFAFPSGHTARAAVLAYFLSRRWKRLRLLWWGWAISISLSRLLLHVHWFSDVLFALVLGPWVGLLVELTESRWLPIYRLVIRKLKLGVFDVE